MSDALIVGIISAVVSLVGVFVASKNTRDSLTHTLDTNQKVMNVEISHIKETISDMKQDIKTHNNYAKLFSESMPVIREQIETMNGRLSNIENKH